MTTTISKGGFGMGKKFLSKMSFNPATHPYIQKRDYPGPTPVSELFRPLVSPIVSRSVPVLYPDFIDLTTRIKVNPVFEVEISTFKVKEKTFGVVVWSRNGTREVIRGTHRISELLKEISQATALTQYEINLLNEKMAILGYPLENSRWTSFSSNSDTPKTEKEDLDLTLRPVISRKNPVITSDYISLFTTIHVDSVFSVEIEAQKYGADNSRGSCPPSGQVRWLHVPSTIVRRGTQNISKLLGVVNEAVSLVQCEIDQINRKMEELGYPIRPLNWVSNSP